MVKAGVALIVLGVAGIVVSIVLFASSVSRALEARQAASIPIAVGKETTTGVIQVDTDRLCQIAVQIDVQSDSVQEKRDEQRDGKLQYALRYEFPARYTVLDENGKTIHEESAKVSWHGSGTRLTTFSEVNARGGRATVEQSLEKFEVPTPGKIRVRVLLGPDKVYQAKAKDVHLNVYDNVSPQAGRLIGGCGLICASPALVLLGVVLTVVGVMQRNRTPAVPGNGADEFQ